MMMKRLAAATVLFFVTTIAAPPLATAQQAPGALSVPIAGTGATFNGAFQLQRFATQFSRLTADS